MGSLDNLNGIESLTDSVEQALSTVIIRHGLTEARASIAEDENYRAAVASLAVRFYEAAHSLGVAPEGSAPLEEAAAEPEEQAEPDGDADDADDAGDLPTRALAAIRQLTPGEASHWTKKGVPDANTVSEIVGEKVGKKVVWEVWSSLTEDEQAALHG